MLERGVLDLVPIERCSLSVQKKSIKHYLPTQHLIGASNTSASRMARIVLCFVSFELLYTVAGSPLKLDTNLYARLRTNVVFTETDNI